MAKSRTPRVEMITWHDSSHPSESGWMSKEKAKQWVHADTLLCQTAGYVLGETKKSVTLALSITPYQAAQLVQIPKPAIKWRLDITPKQKGEKNGKA